MDDFTRHHPSAEPHLTPVDHAVFLAAKSIAIATAYLDGRADAQTTHRNAERISGEMILAGHEPSANRILEPVRLLVVATSRASIAESVTQQDDWQSVMGALVELLRRENSQRRAAGDQR